MPEEKIISIPDEGAAGPVVTELSRKRGTSNAMHYARTTKYGVLEVFIASRLRALEEGNAPLKWLLADTMLNNAGLKELV